MVRLVLSLWSEHLDRSERLTSAVEDHAASAGQVMLLQALLVHGLLGDDVAGAEEDGRGDDLGQQGPLDQLGLVPDGSIIVSICVWFVDA